MTRTRVTLVVVALAALVICVSTAAAIIALVRGETTRSIVEKSPCVVDAKGDACQKAKRESDRAQTVEDACISVHKTFNPEAVRALTRCPPPSSNESTGGGDDDSQTGTTPRPDEPGTGIPPAVDPGNGGNGGGGTSPPTTDPPGAGGDDDQDDGDPGDGGSGGGTTTTTTPEVETPPLIDTGITGICTEIKVDPLLPPVKVCP